MNVFEQRDVGMLQTPMGLNGAVLYACGRAGRMHIEPDNHMTAHSIMAGPDDTCHIAAMKMEMNAIIIMVAMLMILRMTGADEKGDGGIDVGSVDDCDRSSGRDYS